VAKQIIPVGDPELPPAGYERNEELAQREDNLAQAAEERASALETESIDPKKLRVENEIAQNFDPATSMLKVSNPDVCFMYCWAFSGMHGLMITQKQIEGWTVVQGEDPEAIEHKGIGADTTRRVGDTLLMRIPKDKYLLLDRRRKEQANRFNAGSTTFSDRAENLAHKYNIPVYHEGEVDPRTLKRMQSNAEARKVASSKVNQLINQGRMPGMR
jgi:hypothetical protein